MYKEISLGHANKKGAPAPKHRGSQAQPVPPPAFELIGSSIEDMQVDFIAPCIFHAHACLSLCASYMYERSAQLIDC